MACYCGRESIWSDMCEDHLHAYENGLHSYETEVVKPPSITIESTDTKFMGRLWEFIAASSPQQGSTKVIINN